MNPTSPLPQLPLPQQLSIQTSYPQQYNSYSQQVHSEYPPLLPPTNYHNQGQYVDHHDDHYDTHYHSQYQQPQQNTQPQYNTQPRYNMNYNQSNNESNNQPLQQSFQQSHVKQENGDQPTNQSLPSSMANKLPVSSNMVNNSSGTSNSLPLASNNQTLGQLMSSNMGSSYVTLSQQQNLQNLYQRIVSSNPTYAMANGQGHASNLVTQAYRFANQAIPTSVYRTPPPPSKRTISTDGRRTRNLKSPHALKVLKYSFAMNRKPSKDTMRALQRDTGCTYSEICRWFRNERHKEKRLHNNQMLHIQSQQSSPSSSEVDESSRATSPGSRNSGCSSSSSSPQTPTSGAVVPDLRNFLSTPDMINQSNNQIIPEATPTYDHSEWISNFNHSYEEEQQQAVMAAALMQQQQQLAHYGH